MAKNNKTEGQTTDRHTTELTEPDSKEGVGAAGHTVAHKARSAGLGPQTTECRCLAPPPEAGVRDMVYLYRVSPYISSDQRLKK